MLIITNLFLLLLLAVVVVVDVNVVLFPLGVAKIIPCENSRTFVNGKLVTESTVLRSGKCWNKLFCAARGISRVQFFVLYLIFQGLVLFLETITYSDLTILIKVW